MRKLLSIIFGFLLISTGLVLFSSPAQATTYPAGWNDDANTTSCETTIDFKTCTAVQLFRSTSSNDAYDTVTAVRARCAIRKLGPTTGVKVNQCALGVDGGDTLTVDGEFLDGGTCCANGFSPFRFVNNPPSDCCTGFRGRTTFSYRISGTLVGPFNWLSDGGAHVFNLTSG